MRLGLAFDVGLAGVHANVRLSTRVSYFTTALATRDVTVDPDGDNIVCDSVVKLYTIYLGSHPIYAIES